MLTGKELDDYVRTVSHDVYWYVFMMLDCNEAVPGEVAGRVATAAQEVVEREAWLALTDGEND